MTKIDFKKALDCYKAKRDEFRVVEVAPLKYLKIDGAGDPNTSKTWSDAVQCLYPVAYALKFISKIELNRDYVVMQLEALWWSDNMESFTSARDKTRWFWTAMIMIPDWTTDEALERSIAKAAARNGELDFSALRLEPLVEGRCVQTLHVGSYDDEGPVLQRMHNDFIPANHLKMTGKHHEIYLSDARRIPPEKLRTILRQPVKTAE